MLFRVHVIRQFWLVGLLVLRLQLVKGTRGTGHNAANLMDYKSKTGATANVMPDLDDDVDAVSSLSQHVTSSRIPSSRHLRLFLQQQQQPHNGFASDAAAWYEDDHDQLKQQQQQQKRQQRNNNNESPQDRYRRIRRNTLSLRDLRNIFNRDSDSAALQRLSSSPLLVEQYPPGVVSSGDSTSSTTGGSEGAAAAAAVDKNRLMHGKQLLKQIRDALRSDCVARRPQYRLQNHGIGTR